MTPLTLDLGCTLSGQKVSLQNADNPHIAVNGKSGSGKSFFLRKLIAQATHQGALCIVFDYTSDFCECWA